MSVITAPKPAQSASVTAAEAIALTKGEILLQPRPYSAWGGAVTARMYLPLHRQAVWKQLVDYPRWVQYFPDVMRSEVVGTLSASQGCGDRGWRLYQSARKTFLFLVADVEAWLTVFETTERQIQFHLDSGSFTDFVADLQLQDFSNGTLLSYSVQATPTIPVPGLLIQQAIELDLPANLRNMRQVLCRGR